jgi:predicted phosphoribosyltransferase
MRAAIEGVRRQGAGRVVVAVPVGAQDRVAALRLDADEVVCPATPTAFFAIGEFYEDFSQVSDDEVRKLLADTHQLSDSNP